MSSARTCKRPRKQLRDSILYSMKYQDFSPKIEHYHDESVITYTKYNIHSI